MAKAVGERMVRVNVEDCGATDLLRVRPQTRTETPLFPVLTGVSHFRGAKLSAWPRRTLSSSRRRSTKSTSSALNNATNGATFPHRRCSRVGAARVPRRGGRAAAALALVRRRALLRLGPRQRHGAAAGPRARGALRLRAGGLARGRGRDRVAQRDGRQLLQDLLDRGHGRRHLEGAARRAAGRRGLRGARRLRELRRRRRELQHAARRHVRRRVVLFWAEQQFVHSAPPCHRGRGCGRGQRPTVTSGGLGCGCRPWLRPRPQPQQWLQLRPTPQPQPRARIADLDECSFRAREA